MFNAQFPPHPTEIVGRRRVGGGLNAAHGGTVALIEHRELLAVHQVVFHQRRHLIGIGRQRSRVNVAAIDAEADKQIIAALSDEEKTGMLLRLVDGDPHVGYELRARIAERLATSDEGRADVPRTVGELRLRALALGQEHELAAAARQVAERKRREDEAEAARQVRLVSIRRRGEHVWKDVEAEIERRNAQGYGKAVELLGDLRALADQERSTDDFHLRVNHIRDRHAGKRAFIARLTELSLP